MADGLGFSGVAGAVAKSSPLASTTMAPGPIESMMSHVNERMAHVQDGGTLNDTEATGFWGLHQSLGELLAAHQAKAMPERIGNRGGQD